MRTRSRLRERLSMLANAPCARAPPSLSDDRACAHTSPGKADRRAFAAILGQGTPRILSGSCSTPLPSAHARLLLLSLTLIQRCREPVPGVRCGRHMPREAQLETTRGPESKMKVAAPGLVFRQSASHIRGRKCVIGGSVTDHISWGILCGAGFRLGFFF